MQIVLNSECECKSELRLQFCTESRRTQNSDSYGPLHCRSAPMSLHFDFNASLQFTVGKSRKIAANAAFRHLNAISVLNCPRVRIFYVYICGNPYGCASKCACVHRGVFRGFDSGHIISTSTVYARNETSESCRLITREAA